MSRNNRHLARVRLRVQSKQNGDEVKKLYYTIDEVAEVLSVNKSFVQSIYVAVGVSPARRGGQRSVRMFTFNDIERIALGIYLHSNLGMSSDGIARYVSFARRYDSLSALEKGIVNIVEEMKKDSEDNSTPDLPGLAVVDPEDAAAEPKIKHRDPATLFHDL